MLLFRAQTLHPIYLLTKCEGLKLNRRIVRLQHHLENTLHQKMVQSGCGRYPIQMNGVLSQIIIQTHKKAIQRVPTCLVHRRLLVLNIYPYIGAPLVLQFHHHHPCHRWRHLASLMLLHLPQILILLHRHHSHHLHPFHLLHFLPHLLSKHRYSLLR